jgi:signal transduction histidine kinase
MINRALNPDFQRTLVDYFIRAKIILGLTALSLLLFFHYFRLLGVEARPVIFTLVIELLIWGSFFAIRARNPEWILPFNVASLWVDVIAVTIALHYFGGLYSTIWAVDYLFLVACSSAFLSKRGRILFAAYVILVYSLLCHLEHHGVIVRNNVFGIQPSSGLDFFFWASTSLLMVATAILANKLAEIFSQLERFANLGRLSTELAHEIRTPLQVIQGLLHRLHSAEDVKQEIRDQTERIARFVTEILALGREEPPRLARLRIQDIVDHSINLILKAIPAGSEIQVEKSFCEEALWVEGDMDQLIKAFSNLVRNGIDSMNSSGTLSVAVFRYGFEWLQVDIRDTGIGMEKEEFDKIFEPFYTTKTGRRGIGLGLAIAKKLVEVNNGRIEVDSIVGEGSRFTVRLPLSSSA